MIYNYFIFYKKYFYYFNLLLLVFFKANSIVCIFLLSDILQLQIAMKF